MNENQKDTSEKLYTQKELEEILSQRLNRERKNTESLQYIRDALAQFRKQEPYKSLSNARLAEIIIDMAKKNLDGQAQDTAEENNPCLDVPKEKEETKSAEHNGTQPENNVQSTEEMPENDDTVSCEPLYSTTQMSEQKTDVQKEKMSEIAEFLARFGENTMSNAISDRAFRAFCDGKSGSLCQLYESYKAFLAALSQSPEVKKYRELKNGFAATGFSGNSSPVIDYGSLLTENQRQIASASGMSYRQYAELLAQIPTKKLNYKN